MQASESRVCERRVVGDWKMNSAFVIGGEVGFLGRLRKDGLASQGGRRFLSRWSKGPRPFLRMCAGSEDSPFAITTPLFYVNAEPHMGSAYTTMATDAISRSLRMSGKKPVMITGCDEHGDKIRMSAEKLGRSPRDHCDRISSEFINLFDKLGIDYDKFCRTTNPVHEAIVEQFMNRVWDNGDIYKSEYEGLYCTGCEEYKDTKDLVNKDQCPVHQTKCESRKEENYFFALSKYQNQIEKLLEENPDFVQPTRSRNEVLSWVKSGLRDFSVSRANNPWGIPVPKDNTQTIYVWFDALLGYISSLLEPGDEPTIENAIARGWPAKVHIIGKDILRFHAIYWPAMLMSAGLELPEVVFGHGFLTKDGLKMGKSLGNTLDPFALVGTYGADATRYFFLRSIEFGSDGDYNEERFISTVNADLANNLGNLLNRSMNLIRKNCDLMYELDSSEIDHPFRETASQLAMLVPKNLEQLHFTGACQPIVEYLGQANLYIAEEEPWTLFKQGERERAVRCLCTCLEVVRVSAVLLKPVTPMLSDRIYQSLGFPEHQWQDLRWSDAEWGGLKLGHKFPTPVPVFPRLEAPAPVA